MTERLAVMLSAGIPPTAAWEYVAEFVDNPVPRLVMAEHPQPQELAEALSAAVAPLPATESAAWRGLAAAWSIATIAGAPLAPVLGAYAVSLRSLASVQRDIEVALAAPVATARLVLTLPPLGILLGLALGFDTLGVLFGSLAGWLCLLAGSALLLLAVRWNRRLVARAQPSSITPGIECELLAIAVSGGGSLERAQALLEDCVNRFALRDASVARHPSGDGGSVESEAAIAGTIERVLGLSKRAGVPARQLLRSEAEAARRAAG
ncbi:MAG: type II secretion system F family protein, partial [Salinibacterium sp.]|nr:type II secretion system F family protein [Salinibacterium sp.]